VAAGPAATLLHFHPSAIPPQETAAITPEQDPKLHDALRSLLRAGGEDPGREGLLETPARFLRAWQEWTSGYAENPAEILKTFDDGASAYDEMVLVRDIPVYSLCEHHLAPFFGIAHVGYLPRGRIVGLSKLNRLVGAFSRRLQVQERLTTQIADTLFEALAPYGVAVMLECRHMCMESRGIRQPGAATVTSAMRGHLKDDAKSRAEFLAIIGRR
jgi:GTP cyclohydrolase IA